ncbi:hypothetical protein HK405_003452, partial [Cladochytrium tenue]
EMEGQHGAAAYTVASQTPGSADRSFCRLEGYTIRSRIPLRCSSSVPSSVFGGPLKTNSRLGILVRACRQARIQLLIQAVQSDRNLAVPPDRLAQALLPGTGNGRGLTLVSGDSAGSLMLVADALVQ